MPKALTDRKNESAGTENAVTLICPVPLRYPSCTGPAKKVRTEPGRPSHRHITDDRRGIFEFDGQLDQSASLSTLTVEVDVSLASLPNRRDVIECWNGRLFMLAPLSVRCRSDFISDDNERQMSGFIALQIVVELVTNQVP
jgi:hypothetical protein